MKKVFISSVKDYNQSDIDIAVQNLFDELGGAKNIIGTNKKVLLKANLVREMSPDKCGTTHPSIVEAIAKVLINQTNSTVYVGDSSGAPYNSAVMNSIFKTCGMADACFNSGAKLIDDFNSQTQQINGKVVKNLEIIDVFTNADVVINIGKLKTHTFTGYTGAVKNLYGLIPGLVKAQTHSLYPNLSVFCDCLIDIEQFASPKIALHFVDAVMCMEGDGPTNGKPKFVGKIIAGQNPYLVDVAGISFFANPEEMPLIKKAQERGLLPLDLSQVEVDFDEINKDYINDFKTVTVVDRDFTQKGFLQRFLRKNWVTKRPVINTKKCKGCARCYAHCPEKAIDMIGDSTPKKAYIRRKDCIRCYCCQELCPFDAVKLKKPLLYRIMCQLNAKPKKSKKAPKNDAKTHK